MCRDAAVPEGAERVCRASDAGAGGSGDPAQRHTSVSTRGTQLHATLGNRGEWGAAATGVRPDVAHQRGAVVLGTA